MYDDDKARLGHDATDFAAFGLPDPFRGYASEVITIRPIPTRS